MTRFFCAAELSEFPELLFSTSESGLTVCCLLRCTSELAQARSAP